jgi:uncharacterized phage infection (PIP) family protein YhgE
MAKALMMDDPRRALLEARIMERLQRVDDSTLRELDAWLAQPVTDEPGRGDQQSGISRRQLIVASLLGTAAVAGAGVTGNVVGRTDGLTSGLASANARVAGMNESVERLRDEADLVGNRLQATVGLVSLYDRMDAVGLDDAVNSGLSAVASAIGRTAQAAHTLREGFAIAQNNINQLDQGFVVIDGGLARAERAVSTLSGLMQGLEDRLRAAGEPVAPITDALGSFFTSLVGRIPFGVGERILETIERVQAVIGAIPESVENVNRDLIEPLRARFFPREGDNVTVRLLDPLTDLIFRPADRMLSNLANVGEVWQSALERPAREKIEQRAALREQIVAYRSQNDI